MPMTPEAKRTVSQTAAFTLAIGDGARFAHRCPLNERVLH